MDWAVQEAQRWSTAGAVSSASSGTVITASATANAKGSWTQLVASTPFAASGIFVRVGDEANASTRYLIDIGIGSTGNEIVLIPDLHNSVQSSFGFNIYFFPLEIPAGVRLSARVASSRASDTVSIVIYLVDRAFTTQASYQIVTAYGVNAASTTGTTVDAGATLNTKGAWTQIASSTSRNIRSLSVAIGDRGDTVRAYKSYLLDIGIGPALSEQVVIADLYFNAHGGNNCIMPGFFSALPVSIPAGTRLAARMQASTTDATDRLIDVILYGLS
jgi:hypothetical protein